MSIKWMRAELKRLAEKIGADDDEIVLIVISVVDCSEGSAAKEMTYPATYGHSTNYPILGKHKPLHFPLQAMNSEEAANMAEAFILHVRTIEKLRGPAPVGVMDVRPAPCDGSWIFPALPIGTAMKDHVADQYRQIAEAIHEST